MQSTSVGRLRGIKIACVNAFILGFLSAGVVQAFAAELKPATIRMDFILGGKHTPWFVALEKGFYAKRGLAATIQAGTGSAGKVRTIAEGGADSAFPRIYTATIRKCLATGGRAVRE